MKDGLYQVTTGSLCAGFVVENGKITTCAPILRKLTVTGYWHILAKHIPPNVQLLNESK